MFDPAVIQGHARVNAIFPFLRTFLPPAHDACEEPGVVNGVGVGAPAVALAGILGLQEVPCAEHEGCDPGTAAALALRLILEGDLHLLQSLRRESEETLAPPSADCRRGSLPYQVLCESPGPHADGPHRRGEGDGALEVNQGDVVIV